VPLTYR